MDIDIGAADHNPICNKMVANDMQYESYIP